MEGVEEDNDRSTSLKHGNPNVASASAPGKLILFGEHAVVHGEPAIAASLSDLRIHVGIEKTSGRFKGMIVMDLPDIDKKQNYFISIQQLQQLQLQQPPSYHHDYIALKQLLVNSMANPAIQSSILSILYLFHQIILVPHHNTTSPPTGGYLIKVVSRGLPSGAGLGSSAAFSVACTAAFTKLYHQLQSNATIEGQPNEEQLDTINKLAYYSEILLHGTPSGIDNTVSTFGGAIYFTKTTHEIQMDTLSIDEKPMNIILINTNVPRSTKALVSHVQKRKDQHPHIINPILQSIGAISRTFRDMIVSSKEDWNTQTVGELIRMNQSLLCCLGVSHESLNDVCNLAKDYPMKLTGAGGGGCAFVLIQSEQEKEYLQKQLLQQKKWNFTCLSSCVGGLGVQWTKHTMQQLSSYTVPESNDTRKPQSIL